MRAEDFLNGASSKAPMSAEDFLGPSEEQNATPKATDYLKGIASGVGGLASGVGYLAEAAGADKVGAAIRGVGDTTQQYWKDAMTPAGKRAAESQVFEDDPGSTLPKLGDRWGQALGMGVAQSAPSMLAAAIPGGIAAAGLRGIAGLAASRGIGGALAPLAAGTAAPIGGWGANLAGQVAARVPTALGFGAAEGATAGAMNAAQWKSDIEQRPEESLAALPGYASLAAQIGPEAARRQIAEQGAADIMRNTTLSTGAIGALTGGGALGSAFQRATTGAKGGLIGAIGRDAAKEAFQEAPQSAGERLIQNVATRDYFDPNQAISQGVLSDALSGAAIGGAMGGVTGGGSYAISGPLTKAVAAAPVTTVPPTAPGAGQQILPPNASTPAQETASNAGIASAAQFPQFTAPPQPVTGGAPLEQTPTDMPVPQAIQNAPAAPGSPSPVSAADPLPSAKQAEAAGAPIQPPQGPLPSANQAEIAIPPAQGPEAAALPVAAKPAGGIAAALQYPQQVTEGGWPLAQQAADIPLGRFGAHVQQAKKPTQARMPPDAVRALTPTQEQSPVQAKEPWQMSYGEYLNTFDAEGREWEGLRATEHRASVQKAVNEGLMSADAASMEYPDIANEKRRRVAPDRLARIVGKSRGVTDAEIDNSGNNLIQRLSGELKKLFGGKKMTLNEIGSLMGFFGDILSPFDLRMQIGPDINPRGQVEYFGTIRNKVAAVIENSYRDVLYEPNKPSNAQQNVSPDIPPAIPAKKATRIASSSGIAGALVTPQQPTFGGAPLAQSPVAMPIGKFGKRAAPVAERLQKDRRPQEKRIPQRGDRFKDADGNVWEIWNARTSLIEAHPVINGKPVVNRDSGKRFATDERAKAANPEARTDFIPIEKDAPVASRQTPPAEPKSSEWVGASVVFTSPSGRAKRGSVIRVANGKAVVISPVGQNYVDLADLKRSKAESTPLKGFPASDNSPGNVKSLDYARQELEQGSPHWYVANALADDVLGDNSKLTSAAFSYVREADSKKLWKLIDSVAKQLGEGASNNGDVRRATADFVASQTPPGAPQQPLSSAGAPQARRQPQPAPIMRRDDPAIANFIAGRTPAQLAYIAANGKPGYREAAQARMAGDVGRAKLNDLRSRMVAGMEARRIQADAQHIDGKDVEAATPAVIKEAVSEGAQNAGLDLRQAHAILLQRIDSAIASAPSEKDSGRNAYVAFKINKDTTDSVPNTKAHLVEYRAKMANLGANVPLLKKIDEAIAAAPQVSDAFVVFEVPGDGKFKITNTKERLDLFRKKIASNAAGFRPAPKRQPYKSPLQKKPQSGTASDETIREMLHSGELTAALELSKVVGRPLVFGTPSDPNNPPLVKTHSEPIAIKGLNLSVGKGASFEKSGSSQWSVTELESGSFIASGTTKADAEKAAAKYMAQKTPEELRGIIAEMREAGKAKSQAELESRWLKWAEEEEYRIDNAEAIQEKADKERAAREKEAIDAWERLTGQKAQQGFVPFSPASNPYSMDERVISSGYMLAVKNGKGDEFLKYAEGLLDADNQWQKRVIDHIGVIRDLAAGDWSYDGLTGSRNMPRGEFEATTDDGRKITASLEVEGGLASGFVREDKVIKAKIGQDASITVKQARVQADKVIAALMNPAKKETEPATTTEQKQSEQYRYALVNRPPSMGAVPKVQFTVEPRPPAGSPHHDLARHGIMVTDRKLTDQEVESFELAVIADEDTESRLADDVAKQFGEYADQWIEDQKDDPRGFVAAVGQSVGKITGKVRYSIGDIEQFANEVLRRLNEAKKPAEHEEKPPVFNTEDAGSELTYNRRNRLTRGLKWDDIADKDEALRVKEVTKAKVYPKPDYQAMIDGGMTPADAYMVKLVYDSIAIKPNTRAAPSDADLRRYIDGVNRVMSDAVKWANNNTLSRASLLKSVYPNGWREGEDELRVVGGNKVLAALQPGYAETKRATKDIAAGWPEKQESWRRQGFSIISGDDVKAEPAASDYGQRGVVVRFTVPMGTYSRTLKVISVDGTRDTGSPEVRSAIEQGLAEFSGRFVLLDKAKRVVSTHATEEDANEAARALTSRAAKKPTISDKGINVSAAVRAGVDRRMPGEDISSDRLRETFKFKGVNFGNWMKGDANAQERQLHLNHAYDSFMDLAEVLDVPPEAMSLNGMLGVAIGAQGSGGFAAAHFVPGVNEINLTRESGAGSLAHEWAHALDHYFARQAGMARATDPFLTERLGAAPDAGIRPEIVAKFDAIVQAMRKRSATPHEREAKAKKGIADAEVQIGRWLREPLLDRGLTDDAEVSQAVEKIKAGELGDGAIAVSSRSAVRSAVHDLAMLVKKKSGKKLSVDTMIGVNAQAERAKYLRDNLIGDAAHVPQQMVQTQYLDDAVKLDDAKGGKKYWSTSLEMFARAFDAFVSDELESKAAKNTYLSHAGRTGATVPKGDERTSISSAIKGLVDAVETKEGEDGNVALFSFAGQQSATADQFQLDRAKQLIADGANANAVRQQTGWFKNPSDGKWRYEIDDSGASLQNMRMEDGLGMRATSLETILDHPALFAAYPALRDMDVQITIDPDGQEGGSFERGSAGDSKTFGRQPEIKVNARTEEKALSTLLHEIQHGIQNVEGFASGGNLAMFGAQRKTFDTLKDADTFVKSLDDPYKARIVKGWTTGKIAVYVDGSSDPYRDYKRLAGEVESRNVQQRQNFPADKRRLSDPLGTQDVAPEDVIVMFNGKDAKDAPAPANTTRASAMAAVGASPADAAVFDMAAEGKSAQEILAFLSKASRRPFNRVLAAALSRIGVASTVSIDPAAGWRNNQGRNGAKFAASYSPKTDTVALYTPREAERHILHELVHAATLKAIARGGPAARQMQAIFDYVQRTGTMSDQYGMGNFSRFPNETDAQLRNRMLDEFTAELFTNPQFQVRLKQLPAPSGSKLKSAWDWVVRVIANMLGLRTKAQETALDRALSVGAALLQENAALTMPKGETARYHTTWHGSPHKFYTFDLSKIGTGEGAQAYGHGLYVAEEQAVADGYSGVGKALHNIGFSTFDGIPVHKLKWLKDNSPEEFVFRVIEDSKNIDKAERVINRLANADKETALSKKFFDANKGRLGWESMRPDLSDATPNLYKVDLPAEAVARMLDWDKPLSEQPSVLNKLYGAQEAKRKGLLSSIPEIDGSIPYGEYMAKYGSVIDEAAKLGYPKNITGRDLYTLLGAAPQIQTPSAGVTNARGKENAEASSKLLAAGIPGIRYLDQQSRSGEKATYNFVLFDDKLARIIEANGVETGVQPWAPGEWDATQGGERFSQEQPLSGRDPDIRYSLATNWQQSPVAREVAKALDLASRSDKKLSWLNPVQTQYHKAERLAADGKPLFKRVFDLGQKFLNDISRFAVMAENAAPTMFHQIKSIADVRQATGEAIRGDFGKQRNADIRAIAAPLYEGTLYGGGNPMAGIVWNESQLRQKFGLTDRQITLYQEAREAVKVSMDEMAKSLIARHAKREKVMVDSSLRLSDLADEVSNALNLRATVFKDDAEAAHDEAMQQVKDLRDAGQDKRADADEKLADAKLESAMKEVERIGETVKDIKAIADKANKLQEAGYFPLMRFGKHTVTAKDADGKVQHFSMHDGIPLVPRSGQIEANKLADALREEHPDWTVETGLMNPEKYKLYQGMNVDALQLFADHLDDETKQTYQEIIRLATNERSALKRMLKREGTPGFDKDVRRTLASFILSNARYTSSSYHLSDMTKAAESAEKDGGDIGGEAVKLVDYITKPQEEAAKIRGFLFFNFLGGSLAAAMVNATQIPMMTFPRLSQYEPAAKLAARLARVAKIAMMNPEKVPGDIGYALRRAEEDGITAPHQIYELTGTASNNIFAGSLGANAIMRAWGAPFALAESFNRRATFLASYEIAKAMTPAQLQAAGATDAYEFAAKMIAETQGIYNRGNRVNIGRGALGATVMTFKQYSIMYMEMLSRMPLKQQAIMVGMLLLAAGAGGLPFAEDAEDIIDTIGQWMGYRTNTKRTIRNALTDKIGQTAADVTMNGLLSRIGVDLHSRLGLHNILPGSALLKPSTTDKSREFQDLLGPAASVVASLGQAMQSIAEGKPDRAAMALAPVALQNAVKGAKMAATGRAEDMTGKPTIPVSSSESVAKGIGFNPKAMADYGAAKRDILQDERLLDVWRERFTADIVQAVVAQDAEALQEARQAVVDWNARHPDGKIAINPASIRRRVAEMRTEGPQRVLKSLTPALRQQARQDLYGAQ